MSSLNEKKILTITKNKEILQVFLEKTQYKKEALEIIKEYVELEEIKEGLNLFYTVPRESVSLLDYKKQLNTRLEKLRIAEKIAELLQVANDYKIPYLSLDNIYVDGEHVYVMHFGLKEMLTPNVFNPKEILQEVKALILSIFNPKLDFNQLKLGTLALDDKFSKHINKIADKEELIEFLKQERVLEQRKMLKTKIHVPRKNYNIYRIAGVVSTILMIIMAVFFYYYYTGYQKQEAIISSQSSFMTSRYSEAQKKLEKYDPASLPKSAKYVLAVSSIRQTDLTDSQKQSVLNTISLKSDDNTLNYWAYTGRGNFEKALNLSQNLGDDQLILLAYTNLYQATKLNTKMDGAKKQKLLEEYKKQIDELSEKLTGSSDKEQ